MPRLVPGLIMRSSFCEEMHNPAVNNNDNNNSTSTTNKDSKKSIKCNDNNDNYNDNVYNNHSINICHNYLNNDNIFDNDDDSDDDDDQNEDDNDNGDNNGNSNSNSNSNSNTNSNHNSSSNSNSNKTFHGCQKEEARFQANMSGRHPPATVCISEEAQCDDSVYTKSTEYEEVQSEATSTLGLRDIEWCSTGEWDHTVVERLGTESRIRPSSDPRDELLICTKDELLVCQPVKADDFSARDELLVCTKDELRLPKDELLICTKDELLSQDENVRTELPSQHLIGDAKVEATAHHDIGDVEESADTTSGHGRHDGRDFPEAKDRGCLHNFGSAGWLLSNFSVKHTFLHYDDINDDLSSLDEGEGSPKSPQRLRSASAPSLLMENPVFMLVHPKGQSEMELTHANGACNPCAYFHRKQDSCRLGSECKFCHLCPPQAMRKHKKLRMKARRHLENEQWRDDPNAWPYSMHMPAAA